MQLIAKCFSFFGAGIIIALVLILFGVYAFVVQVGSFLGGSFKIRSHKKEFINLLRIIAANLEEP